MLKTSPDDIIFVLKSMPGIIFVLEIHAWNGPKVLQAEDNGDDGDWSICWDFERNDWGGILKTSFQKLSRLHGIH